MKQRFARTLCRTLLLVAGAVHLAHAEPAPAPVASVPALQPLAPVQPAQPDLAHLDAVAALLEATHIPEATMAGLLATVQSTPDPDGFAQYMQSHLSKADLARALAPVYAPHLTADSTARLAAAFATPQALRVAQLQQARDRAPTSAPGNLADRADRADWDAFNASAPVRTIAAIERDVSDQARTAIALLMSARSGAVLMQALRDLAAHIKAWTSTSELEAPALYTPPETGLSSIDRLVNLLAYARWHDADLAWRYRRDLEALGVRDLLAPATLVSRGGVARGLATLDAADARLSVFAREVDDGFDAFRRGLVALYPPNGGETGKQLTSMLEKNLGTSVATVESQRALLVLTRRVLTFAQQRPGHITLENGKPVLQGEDRVLYNGMVAELKRELARSNAIAERAEGAGKMQPDGSRPPAAAAE